MFGKEVGVQPLVGSKGMNICDRANEERGRRSAPGPFSWYINRRAVSEVKHVLTAGGYVALP